MSSHNVTSQTNSKNELRPTAAQIRMARAALNETQAQLGRRAGVHARTVRLVEGGVVRGHPETLMKIGSALQSAGIVLTAENGVQAPVIP